MVKTKEELQIRKKELEIEKEQIEAELRHVELPESMRDEWKLGFGWPKLSQELVLKGKLDEETYNALYDGVEAIVERIAGMVPAYEDTKKPCETCAKVKELVK